MTENDNKLDGIPKRRRDPHSGRAAADRAQKLMRRAAKSRGGALRRTIAFARPYILLIVAAVLLSAVHVAATLLVPIFTGRAVDVIVGAGDVNFTLVLQNAAYAGICIGINVVSQWLTSLCTDKAALDMVKDMRIALFAKLNSLPVKYLDSASSGDLMARVAADTDQVSDGLIQGFTQLFSGIATVVGTLAFMLAISWEITIIVVVITPLSIIVAYVIARGSNKHFVRQSAHRGRLSGLIEEMINNQKIVKAFNYEKRAEARFDSINQDLKNSYTKAVFYGAITNPSTRLINSLVYAAVAVTGALMIISNPVGALTVGNLYAALHYSNQYAKPFNEITGVITDLQTAMAGAKRVFEIMDLEEEVDAPGSVDIAGCDGNVDIENVEFSYTPVPLITDLNLSVKKGQRIAIVGPTGCGKTTIINLLMRFYDINAGSIKLDGIPIDTLTRSSLRRCYGMVLQDSWLFTGTIRENIAYGRPDASLDEISQAAQKAHIHNYIIKLEKGYDTIIDNGTMSLGEMQLLCIARIMLTQPPLLILDEATSNIDTRTEKLIQDSFKLMMEGRTSFIIAHRLSTIKEADLIVVMDSGNVVEKGRHSELLESGGFYAKLYQSQFDSSKR